MKNFYLRATLVLVAIGLSLSAFAQMQVSGTVMDAALGEPIIGANIIEKGTTNGTITDFDGN
ncbi:MAG: carboxypeptidase-like regulatory domain-containing protein, partial [Bacteroidales bacterium]|nr:carboxypeptidase-like regulatory domain-containing protein [Candidatus Colicola caccequi]